MAISHDHNDDCTTTNSLGGTSRPDFSDVSVEDVNHLVPYLYKVGGVYFSGHKKCPKSDYKVMRQKCVDQENLTNVVTKGDIWFENTICRSVYLKI